MFTKFLPIFLQLLLVASLTRPPSGIKNTGASCYLASLLQALFHVPIFQEYILSRTHLERSEKTDMEVALAEAFSLMKGADMDILDLEAIFQKSYVQFVKEKEIDLSTYGQDDSAAFFDALIAYAIPQAQELFRIAHLPSLSFHGTTFSEIHDECVYQLLIKKEHYPDSEECNLQDACQKAIEGVTDVLEDYNMDYIWDHPGPIESKLLEDKCNYPNEKALHFIRLVPKGSILVVTFYVRINGNNNNTIMDPSAIVHYPETLMLTTGTYHLCSFVCATYEHYYAYVKSDAGDDAWYMANDSIVKKVSKEEAFMKQRNAYMLFYARDDGLKFMEDLPIYKFKVNRNDALSVYQVPEVPATSRAPVKLDYERTRPIRVTDTFNPLRKYGVMADAIKRKQANAVIEEKRIELEKAYVLRREQRRIEDEEAALMEQQRIEEAARMEQQRIKKAALMDQQRIEEAARMEQKRIEEAARMEKLRIDNKNVAQPNETAQLPVQGNVSEASSVENQSPQEPKGPALDPDPKEKDATSASGWFWRNLSKVNPLSLIPGKIRA